MDSSPQAEASGQQMSVQNTPNTVLGHSMDLTSTNVTVSANPQNHSMTNEDIQSLIKDTVDKLVQERSNSENHNSNMASTSKRSFQPGSTASPTPPS